MIIDIICKIVNFSLLKIYVTIVIIAGKIFVKPFEYFLYFCHNSIFLPIQATPLLREGVSPYYFSKDRKRIKTSVRWEEVYSKFKSIMFYRIIVDIVYLIV